MSKYSRAKSYRGHAEVLGEVAHCGRPTPEQIAQARERLAAEHPDWRPARVQQRAWVEVHLRPARAAG